MQYSSSTLVSLDFITILKKLEYLVMSRSPSFLVHSLTLFSNSIML